MTATDAIQQLRTLENEQLELDVLLAQAIRFIPLFVTKQVRYKVTDIPTKRTIQYYVHKGLISKPGVGAAVLPFPIAISCRCSP